VTALFSSFLCGDFAPGFFFHAPTEAATRESPFQVMCGLSLSLLSFWIGDGPSTSRLGRTFSRPGFLSCPTGASWVPFSCAQTSCMFRFSAFSRAREFEGRRSAAFLFLLFRMDTTALEAKVFPVSCRHRLQNPVRLSEVCIGPRFFFSKVFLVWPSFLAQLLRVEHFRRNSFFRAFPLFWLLSSRHLSRTLPRPLHLCPYPCPATASYNTRPFGLL